MKRILPVFALLLCSLVASPALDRPELDRRLQKQLEKFQDLQSKKPVPADVLKKAKGIVLLDRTKAGFVFAFQGGNGVAVVRDAEGKWGPVAFLKANEASLGFQIGGQQSFLVMLLMTDDAARTLADPNFEFGGEARGTAGDASTGTEANIKTAEQPVMIYDVRTGLFGGAAVKGGALSPNTEANQVYYGELFTVKEILFGQKVQPTPAAVKLAEAIERYAAKP